MGHRNYGKPIESLHANVVLSSNGNGFHARTLYHNRQEMDLSYFEGMVLKPALLAPGLVSLDFINLGVKQESNGSHADKSLEQHIEHSVKSLVGKFSKFGTVQLACEWYDSDGAPAGFIGFRPFDDAIRIGNLVAYTHGGHYFAQNVASGKREPLWPKCFRYLNELANRGAVAREYLLREVHGYGTDTQTHAVQSNIHRLRKILDSLGFEDALPRVSQGIYRLNKSALEP